MRSRLLIGVSGWLLGAATATCGSMLAVDHLANGLVATGSQQLSTADVRNDLAGSADASARPSAANPARTKPAPARTPAKLAGPRSGASPEPSDPSDPSGSAPAGSLLLSKGGSVMAVCQAGQAYLQYWSPAQGFQADDVFRGPAAQARITFESVGGSVVMTVTCAGGQPTAKLSTDPGDGPHDH